MGVDWWQWRPHLQAMKGHLEGERCPTWGTYDHRGYYNHLQALGWSYKYEHVPTQSMELVYSHTWMSSFFMVNVGKYTILWVSGIVNISYIGFFWKSRSKNFKCFYKAFSTTFQSITCLLQLRTNKLQSELKTGWCETPQTNCSFAWTI